jgi:hypothetical protein
MLGTAQLMVILDATIVNIALPSAQKALDFTDDNRQWVITAYALAFGSLLLGGRIADLFGRKSTFIVGLVAAVHPSDGSLPEGQLYSSAAGPRTQERHARAGLSRSSGAQSVPRSDARIVQAGTAGVSVGS